MDWAAGPPVRPVFHFHYDPEWGNEHEWGALAVFSVAKRDQKRDNENATTTQRRSNIVITETLHLPKERGISS
ncbi:MAG: hypothetical protein IJ131_01330 [Eggerthellaceae bacterium]|nr:hypothetical protein [Eggerthellaceae bacterium]